MVHDTVKYAVSVAPALYHHQQQQQRGDARQRGDAEGTREVALVPVRRQRAAGGARAWARTAITTVCTPSTAAAAVSTDTSIAVCGHRPAIAPT